MARPKNNSFETWTMFWWELLLSLKSRNNGLDFRAVDDLAESQEIRWEVLVEGREAQFLLSHPRHLRKDGFGQIAFVTPFPLFWTPHRETSTTSVRKGQYLWIWSFLLGKWISWVASDIGHTWIFFFMEGAALWNLGALCPKGPGMAEQGPICQAGPVLLVLRKRILWRLDVSHHWKKTQQTRQKSPFKGF